MMVLNNKYTGILLLILVSFSIFFTHSNVLANIWLHSFDDGTYSHAYLIVVITVYLYWEGYKEGALEIRSHVSLLAVVIFLVCLYLAHLLILAQLTNGARLTTLAVLIASINLIFKSSIKSVFPAAFLVFVVPIWGVLVTPLQSLSVTAVTHIMSFTHIPVFVDGNFITIPAGVFEIAGGCSGLRYLLVSIAISCLYIYLYMRNAQSAIKFFLFAVLGALLTNWIRIALLIIIGHETNMESSLMKDHNNFGWYLYIPYMFLLFFYGHKISTPQLSKKTEIKTTQQINVTALSIYIVSLLVVFGLKQFSYSNYMSNIKCNNTVDYASSLEPNMKHVMARCVTENNNIQQIRYFFDPENLDSKPDYYANTLTPTKYNALYEIASSSTHAIVVDEKYYVKMDLYSANIKTESLKSFKLERILNAISNNSGTSVAWSQHACKPDKCIK